MDSSNTPSIKKNFVMNVVLTVSTFIFPLISFRYVTNILSTDGYGKVRFATSVINYFSMFAQLGIPTYGIRACAMVRDDRQKLSETVYELLYINFLTCVITYIALIISVFLIRRFYDDRILFFIISAIIFFNAIGIEWMYKGLEQYTYITVRSIMFKVVALIAMFLLVKQESDYVMYGIVSILASSGSNVMNFLNARKFIDRTHVKHEWKKHLKPVLVFFAMAAATTIYTNLDAVMLGFIKTDSDVAFYDAAVKVKTILVGVVTSLGAVILPRASYYIENKMWQEFKRISSKAIHFVLLVSLPLAVFFMIYADRSIYLLSGEKYASSIVPMMILMPTLILIGITNILGIQILVPLGKEKYVLYSVIGGAITDLVLNAVLIPRLASIGAAIGTLAAEFVVLLLQIWFLKDRIAELFTAVNISKILISLVLGTFAGLIVKLIHASDFIALFVAAISFFGTYGIMLLVLKENMMEEIVRTVFSKLKKKSK